MFDDFEWDPEMVPGIKLGFHIFQILFAFVCWCLEISVFRADGSVVNGQNGWVFGVCFLTIPAWIYLIGAPRFPRTRKVAEPHAMAGVDAFFAIVWLSAFASQASYNTANLCGTACSQSKAIVGLGFFVTLFFCFTTAISIYTLRYYRFHNRLPGYDKLQIRNQNIDPDKAAFSMAPGDEEAYSHVPMNDGHDGAHHHDHHDHDDAGGPSDAHHSQAGGYNDTAYGGSVVSGSGGRTSPYNAGAGGRASPYNASSVSGVPGRASSPYGPDPYGPESFGHGPRSENPFDDHSDYHSQVGAAGSAYAPPSAQDDFDDDRPVHFPAGRYDRGV